jgi:hypothetical protein
VTRPPHYLAPSWSWASLLGDVETQHARGFKKSAVSILEARYFPKTEHLTAQITSGCIKLEGWLLEVKIVFEIQRLLDSPAWSRPFLNKDSSLINLSLDFPEYEGAVDGTVFCLLLGHGAYTSRARMDSHENMPYVLVL